MNLKETYNAIAEAWRDDHRSDTWWIEGADAFASHLPKSASILDVGCGFGLQAAHFSEQGFRVHGIDFSESMIELAKQEAPKATFEVCDVYNLGSVENTFDGALMQACLLHIPKKDARMVLGSVAQKLNPGGLLYVAVKGLRPGAHEEEVKREEKYGTTFERFFSYYTPDELKSHFEALGVTPMYEHVFVAKNTEWIELMGRK